MSALLICSHLTPHTIPVCKCHIPECTRHVLAKLQSLPARSSKASKGSTPTCLIVRVRLLKYGSMAYGYEFCSNIMLFDVNSACHLIEKPQRHKTPDQLITLHIAAHIQVVHPCLQNMGYLYLYLASSSSQNAPVSCTLSTRRTPPETGFQSSLYHSSHSDLAVSKRP
jgi:hypothetical protein